jgi:hypothetical protein
MIHQNYHREKTDYAGTSVVIIDLQTRMVIFSKLWFHILHVS